MVIKAANEFRDKTTAPIQLWQTDFTYRVEVRGNNFVQTGGDAGTVTGAFFGAAHEGMGSVIVRDDLSARFGGTR